MRFGYLKISNFNVMIFDECHNAQKSHPMALLMAKFKECEEKDHPRVIGLTGSLTAAAIKPQNVLEDLKKLEATFRGTITTAVGDAFNDVLTHSTQAKENTLPYESNKKEYMDELISLKVEGMLRLISIWPENGTHDLSHDLRFNKVKRLTSKLEDICKGFIVQHNNLGKNVVNVYGFDSSERYSNTIISIFQAGMEQCCPPWLLSLTSS